MTLSIDTALSYGIGTDRTRTLCSELSALYLRVNEHSLYTVNLMKLGFNLFESCSEIVLHLKCRELLTLKFGHCILHCSFIGPFGYFRLFVIFSTFGFFFELAVSLALLAVICSLTCFLRLAFSSPVSLSLLATTCSSLPCFLQFTNASISASKALTASFLLFILIRVVRLSTNTCPQSQLSYFSNVNSSKTLSANFLGHYTM